MNAHNWFGATAIASATVFAPTVASTQARTGVVKVNGGTIPYEIQGSGPPVVFIHGYAQNMSIWDEQVPAFASRYRVIRYDVRGFGRSMGDVDQTAHAADLASLLDSLRLDRVAIVGLSMGAEIALNFAVTYPMRVNTLVLYGAPPTRDFPVPAPELFAFFSTLPNIAKTYGLDSLRKALFASELAWAPPNRPDINRKLLKAWEGYTARDLTDPKPPSGRVPPTRMSQVNTVRVPVLLVHGDHEIPWFRQFNDTLMARLPDARRVIIENGGHGAHFAQPERFNRAVLDFVDSIRLRAVAPASAPRACLTATAECTEWVALGGGTGRSLIYRNFPLDTRNEAISRVSVMIHGAGRNADGYFQSILAAGFLAGALENTLIIAPRMASNDGANCRDSLAVNEISWHCNTWRSGGPSLTHPGVTSFDFLDELLRKVARRQNFPNVRAIVVSGHSAGGQVVNRYSMSNQVHDALGIPVVYVVSNPSSYAYPDSLRPSAAAYAVTANAPGYVPRLAPNAEAFRSFGDARNCATYDSWPFGMRNRTGYSSKQSDEQLRRQLAARPVIYLLGELDILPLGGFDGSCAAMAQGPTRLARGQAFAKYATEVLGAKHRVVVVSLCGHNARCMFTAEAALPLIFPRE